MLDRRAGGRSARRRRGHWLAQLITSAVRCRLGVDARVGMWRADLAAMPLTLCHAWCDDDEEVVADRWIDAVMRAGFGDTAGEGSPGPGFGAWPGIVPSAPTVGFPRLIRLRLGLAVMDSCMATGPGGTGRAVPVAAERWATPGMRPRLLPPL